MPLDGEHAQKAGDVRAAQLAGMSLAVEEDVATDPGDVRLFRAAAIVPDAKGLADAIEQPRLGKHRRH